MLKYILYWEIPILLIPYYQSGSDDCYIYLAYKQYIPVSYGWYVHFLCKGEMIMLFHNNKHKNEETHEKRQKIIINTDYGSIEVVDLKRIWVNEILGTYRLMYQDSKYEYNCIYWSDSKNSINRYLKYKRKIIEAYNRGDKIIEI